MPEPTRTPGSVSQRLLSAMLRSSFVVSQGALLIAIGVGFWLDGVVGAANAAVGGALVIAFFAAGQGVQLLAGELEPRAGMGVVLTSYLVRAALLAGLLLLVARSDRIAEVFRPVPFVLGVFLVLSGWLGGMFWAHGHSRIPVYDSDLHTADKH